MTLSKLATAERRTPATERVAGTLRARIIRGEIVPGQRLTEEKLSQQLEVSRGPIREALRRLADEGLIELVPNKGARVRMVTRTWLADLFEAREIFEGVAARLAAQNMQSPEDKAWLEHHRRSWSDSILHDNSAVFFEENVRFHQGVIGRCGNSYLMEFTPKLRAPIPRHLSQFFDQHDEGRRRVSAQDHVQICEAILAHDSVGAETLMRYHVRRTANLLGKIPDSAFDG